MKGKKMFEEIYLEQIIIAIELEALFADWCGDYYELFSSGGEFPGLGTPRETFLYKEFGIISQ